MKKIIPLLVIILLLASCAENKDKVTNKNYTKDTNGFNFLVNQFSKNIEKLWGPDEILTAGPKDYIKYTNRYETRSHVNFKTGTITVETISTNNPAIHLRQGIINILLMRSIVSCNDDIDLCSDINGILIKKEPLLYGEIVDNTGTPIRWKSHAEKFADYLLKTKLKIRTTRLRQIWSIKIQLVPNHIDKRAHKYLDLVRKASQKYGVDQSLILAIIQTESSFNPYAVSHANALGLMQIVQHSAGRDVFKMQGKFGQPSHNYLFNPKNNIDIGAAYLAMLENNYLDCIVNSTSRRYAVIAAYNGGASSVLRVFSRDKNQAFQIINKMQPDDVYEALQTRHHSMESRHFLYKVNNLQKNYRCY